MTQKELDEKLKIIPDQWLKYSFSENDLYEKIPLDEEIMQALKSKVEELSLKEVAKSLHVTPPTVKRWMNGVYPKRFTFSEWKYIHELTGIERKIVFIQSVQDNIDYHESVKKMIWDNGWNWDSDKLGIEANEALSHYIARYYRKIPIKKIAESIGLPEKMLKWPLDGFSPDANVGKEIKERIRSVCNETWPDSSKMWEITYSIFPPKQEKSAVVREKDEYSQTVEKLIEKKVIPPKTGKNNSPQNAGCATVAIIFFIWGFLFFRNYF